MVDEKLIKLLSNKLRQPIHIDYISRYIIQKPIEETIQIIDELVSQNILEESKYAKDYYVTKQN
jgi:flagellar motor switch protein FliM